MNTTPLQNQPGNGNGKKWTRAGIAAAVASGALTVEAANLLYDQLDKEDASQTGEAEEQHESDAVDSTAQQSEAEDSDQNSSAPSSASSSSSQSSHSYSDAEYEPQHEFDPQSEPEPEPEVEPEPEPEPEPVPEPTPEPEPTPGDEPNFDEDDDIVDIIVEEIDPQDIDMEDVLLIDDIGTIYMADGRELNAAVIHDEFGNEALMVDVDGDNVYDVITTPEGEIIEGIPGDIDVSDAELLYAQQHGDSGYLEQNDFDIAMNDDNLDIQDDISLT